MEGHKPDGIAIVIANYRPIIGGAEKKAERLALHYAVLKVNTLVLTRHAPGEPERETGTHLEVLRLKGKGFVFYLRVLKELFVHRKKYQVIHNFLLSSLSLTCCLAGEMMGKPVFISLGGIGAHGGMTDRTGTGTLSGLKIWLIKLLGPIFISPSADTRREVLDSGIPEERSLLVPNPVNTEIFYPPSITEKEVAKTLLRLNGKIFLFVGRMVEEKNLPRLLSAWKIFAAKNSGCTLVLAGDGPDKAAAMKLAQEDTTVRFEGEVADTTPYYRAADFFILSSSSEGMSNALLEAMACGIPPITTDVSGTEAVENGVNGFKYPSQGSSQELAAAMEKASRMSPQELLSISIKARLSMENRYSLAKVSELLLNEYYRKI